MFYVSWFCLSFNGASALLRSQSSLNTSCNRLPFTLLKFALGSCPSYFLNSSVMNLSSSPKNQADTPMRIGCFAGYGCWRWNKEIARHFLVGTVRGSYLHLASKPGKYHLIAEKDMCQQFETLSGRKMLIFQHSPNLLPLPVASSKHASSSASYALHS